MAILKNRLKDNFGQIPNQLVTDKRISHSAFRMMCYLYTLPTGWNVSNNDICVKLDIGEYSIAKYWKELVNVGWIKRNRIMNKGQFGNYEYEIMESPDITEPDEEASNTEIFRSGENMEINNTQIISNTNTIINTNTNNNKDMVIFSENSFSAEELEAIVNWISYKKEQFNFKYKPVALRGLYNKLIKLKNYGVLVKSIQNSIDNGWRGIFCDNSVAVNMYNEIEKLQQKLVKCRELKSEQKHNQQNYAKCEEYEKQLIGEIELAKEKYNNFMDN